MNKRKAKKAKMYKNLTYKEKLKDQAKTINQLSNENQKLKNQVSDRDDLIELLEHLIDLKNETLQYTYELMEGMKGQIAKLKKPYWKKVFRIG